MKLKLLGLALSSLLLVRCTSTPNAPEAKVSDATQAAVGMGGSYVVDTTLSKVAWIGTKVKGRHEGIFPIKEGKLMANDSALTGGNFVLDVAGLQVHNEDGETTKKLTGHLHSPDFFDVKNHPTAKFEITSVKPLKTDSTTHEVSGNLTMHGVTKQISFPASVSVQGEPKRLSALANFNINRQDWGVKYTGAKDNLVRDLVNIKINLVAEAEKLGTEMKEEPKK